MIRLLHLSCKNFMSFEDLKVDLRKPGLYLISGQNDRGGDSNGSGKSSIFGAISYCLFGRTPKGVAGQDVVRWGSTASTEVELALLDGDDLLRITRGPDRLELCIGDTPAKGTRPDIQRQINDVLKSDFFLFINSACFSQGEGEFLCESTDSTKKRLLKAISGLDAIDRMYELAHKKSQSTTLQAVVLEAELGRSKEYIKEMMSRVESLQKQEENFNADRQLRISQWEKEKSNVESEETQDSHLQSELSIASRIRQLESEVLRLPMDSEEQLGLCRTKQIEASTRLTDVQYLLSQIAGMGGSCNICGSILSRKALASRKCTLDAQCKELLESISTYDSQARELESDLATRESYDARLRELEQEQGYARIQNEALKKAEESRRKMIESINARIIQERSAANPYTSMVGETAATLLNVGTEVRSKESLFTKTKKDIDAYAFLKWTLSREGVSSFIIEQMFGRLEQVANYYLGSLSTEKFTLKIRPQREKKTGGVKEEIEVKILTDAREIPYGNLSDGQRQRVNIALLVATYKLCQDLGVNRFDFLLLDEVLDLSLDQKGQEDVIQFVRGLLSEIHAIYVISHKADISDQFEYEIAVSRDKEGVSRIEGGPY